MFIDNIKRLQYSSDPALSEILKLIMITTTTTTIIIIIMIIIESLAVQCLKMASLRNLTWVSWSIIFQHGSMKRIKRYKKAMIRKWCNQKEIPTNDQEMAQSERKSINL